MSVDTNDWLELCVTLIALYGDSLGVGTIIMGLEYAFRFEHEATLLTTELFLFFGTILLFPSESLEGSSSFPTPDTCCW